ncbi:hypothetical protein ACLOJK_007688 [Asimina triloba]
MNHPPRGGEVAVNDSNEEQGPSHLGFTKRDARNALRRQRQTNISDDHHHKPRYSNRSSNSSGVSKC